MRIKVNMLAKSISTFLILTLLFTCVCLSACDNDEPGFGIYLVETGELVLSDQHIKGYYWDSHAIELNAEGIEKWNSYITYGGLSIEQETMDQDDFIVKLKGKEIYRGKFNALFSSMFIEGVVILDTGRKLNDNQSIIVIQYHPPISHPDTEEDPRNNQEVFDYLESKGLLKPGEKGFFE